MACGLPAQTHKPLTHIHTYIYIIHNIHCGSELATGAAFPAPEPIWYAHVMPDPFPCHSAAVGKGSVHQTNASQCGTICDTEFVFVEYSMLASLCTAASVPHCTSVQQPVFPTVPLYSSQCSPLYLCTAASVPHCTSVQQPVFPTVPLYSSQCSPLNLCTAASVPHCTSVQQPVALYLYSSQCSPLYLCTAASVPHCTSVQQPVFPTVPLYSSQCSPLYLCTVASVPHCTSVQ